MRAPASPSAAWRPWAAACVRCAHRWLVAPTAAWTALAPGAPAGLPARKLAQEAELLAANPRWSASCGVRRRPCAGFLSIGVTNATIGTFSDFCGFSGKLVSVPQATNGRLLRVATIAATVGGQEQPPLRRLSQRPQKSCDTHVVEYTGLFCACPVCPVCHYRWRKQGVRPWLASMSLETRGFSCQDVPERRVDRIGGEGARHLEAALGGRQ
jgi:hypothetical protein